MIEFKEELDKDYIDSLPEISFTDDIIKAVAKSRGLPERTVREIYYTAIDVLHNLTYNKDAVSFRLPNLGVLYVKYKHVKERIKYFKMVNNYKNKIHTRRIKMWEKKKETLEKLREFNWGRKQGARKSPHFLEDKVENMEKRFGIPLGEIERTQNEYADENGK